MSFPRLIAAYYDAFGPFGAFAFLCHHVARHPREIKARPPKATSPVYLRVGTSDAWLYREILLRGQYELNLPFTPKTIVDAGANIGLASIHFARRYPQARIISVEPEASNFAILCRNVSTYRNIVPVHAALWNKDGFIGLNEPNRYPEKWGFIAQEGKGEQVRALTMRTLMREHKLESIDLLKVDIEGSEKELFEDAAWSATVQALAIELHDHIKPGCSAAVEAAMSGSHHSRRGEVNLYLRPRPFVVIPTERSDEEPLPVSRGAITEMLKKRSILVALPFKHARIDSVESLLAGGEACSGTIGAIVRGAHMLSALGHDVTLSGQVRKGALGLIVTEHDRVKASDYDLILTHQSHWQDDAEFFTFERNALSRTHLWFQNQCKWRTVAAFVQNGGLGIVCPSVFHANLHRAIPGFHQKVRVIYNSVCPLFQSDQTVRPSHGRLLFVGAITPTKGFREVMAAWKELATRRAKQHLVIAGSIGLHYESASGERGEIGVAEPKFEAEEIVPWLRSLPEAYRPRFLGALAPAELRSEMLKASAILVNPSWESYETFCNGAVEAQKCGRPIFSVARGGLNETVFPSPLRTLATAPGSEALAAAIERGFTNPEGLAETGRAAAGWAAKKFASDVIKGQFEQLVEGARGGLRPRWIGSGSRDLLCDWLRWTNTAVPFERLILKR